MQRALQQAFAHSTEGQKVSETSNVHDIKGKTSVDFQKQFSELFSLAVEDETAVSGRRGTSSRGGRKPPTKKESNSNSNSNTRTTKSSEHNSKYSSEESSDVS